MGKESWRCYTSTRRTVIDKVDAGEIGIQQVGSKSETGSRRQGSAQQGEVSQTAK